MVFFLNPFLAMRKSELEGVSCTSLGTQFVPDAKVSSSGRLQICKQSTIIAFASLLIKEENERELLIVFDQNMVKEA